MHFALAALVVFGQAPGAAAADQGHRSSAEWLPRTSSPESAAPLSLSLVAEEALPTNFDWRSVGGKSYVTSDWNQHIPQYCGACWIHGTLAALNDRIKVRRNAAFPDIRLGRQSIMNCVPARDAADPPPGCNGGDATMIHSYLSEQKMPDETCMPYQAKNMGCDASTVCRNCAPGNKCWAVKNYIGYGVSSYGSVSGEKAMMKEIYARGPIVCSFATDDLWMYHYSENVVQHDGVYMGNLKKNASQVDHDMEVAGWGETASGDKYWIIRNSWGTYWGQAGWGYLQRGTNALMSEADCAWAEPSWDDLDEELAGKVLGDYKQGIGILPEKKAENTPLTQAASASPAPVVAGAFFAGGSVALLAVLLVAGRKRVRQQPLLLG